jgi:hypothetical protein
VQPPVNPVPPARPDLMTGRKPRESYAEMTLPQDHPDQLYVMQTKAMTCLINAAMSGDQLDDMTLIRVINACMNFYACCSSARTAMAGLENLQRKRKKAQARQMELVKHVHDAVKEQAENYDNMIKAIAQFLPTQH